MKNSNDKKRLLDKAVALFLLALTVYGIVDVGQSISNKGQGYKGPSLNDPNQTQSASTGNPTHTCAWPRGNPLVMDAVSGLDESTNPFYKNIPEVMVQTHYVLESIETNVTKRLNLVSNPIPLLTPAKDRIISVQTPFQIFGRNYVCVSNNGKVSVGGEHGQGETTAGDV